MKPGRVFSGCKSAFEKTPGFFPGAKSSLSSLWASILLKVLSGAFIQTKGDFLTTFQNQLTRYSSDTGLTGCSKQYTEVDLASFQNSSHRSDKTCLSKIIILRRWQGVYIFRNKIGGSVDHTVGCETVHKSRLRASRVPYLYIGIGIVFRVVAQFNPLAQA